MVEDRRLDLVRHQRPHPRVEVLEDELVHVAAVLRDHDPLPAGGRQQDVQARGDVGLVLEHLHAAGRAVEGRRERPAAAEERTVVAGSGRVGHVSPPISTVGAPGGITMPPPAVESVTRAAGLPPISTVAEPLTIVSAPQLSPSVAAGMPPISTVGVPGGMIGTGRALGGGADDLVGHARGWEHVVPPQLIWTSEPLMVRVPLGLDARRPDCALGLEARLRLALDVGALDLHVAGRLERQVLGALERDPAVVEGDLVAVLVDRATRSSRRRTG